MSKHTIVQSGVEKITKICILITVLVAFLVLTLLFTGGGKDGQGVIKGRTMGTSYQVKYWYTDVKNAPDNTQLKKQIEHTLKQVNAEVSTWDKTSTISKFNASRSTDWVSVKPFFAEMVAQSIAICHNTYGAFDITIAPLIDIWGFDVKGRVEQRPDTKLLAKALNRIGCDKVEADVSASQIKKNDPSVRINLSAIAKGDGVDQVANVLKNNRIYNYMVEIGGEIVAHGTRKDMSPWKIGIETPDSQNRSVQEVISLHNKGMATSGDYRNYFEQDGVRYSHLINPQTGFPIAHKLASVSVLADTSRTADVWATAFSILGAGRALQLANKNRLPIMMILRTDTGFEVVKNTHWDVYQKANP